MAVGGDSVKVKRPCFVIRVSCLVTRKTKQAIRKGRDSCFVIRANLKKAVFGDLRTGRAGVTRHPVTP